ncbi:TlyA family RNA methyltransferase [Nocardioides sambongensis]|uniref:TlyA family RNA methyltransferase n=1 Tax=Nocardioides sambongensis TaxID=2589074 RepID=UPI00112782A0|nr:TlyA family RNA methyltransferase [Nocardioides sambongensis]
MPPRRLRLDAELVRRGLAPSRERAARMIAEGRVKVSGVVASKAATGVTTDVAIVVREPEDGPDYVSRGAHKLLGALRAFEPLGLQVRGRRCLDAGASTGGFTDVLLRAGAAEVVAVDVGYGQLDWSLQSDDRVRVHDRTNVRTLTADQVGGHVDVVVGDLSFISLTLVLDALLGVTRPDGDLALMVKPQFEVGKERVGKGGVVRDPELRAEAVNTVAAAAAARGWGARAVTVSPLPGPSGNVEFFVWLRHGPAEVGGDEIAAVVRRGTDPDPSDPDERVAT